MIRTAFVHHSMFIERGRQYLRESHGVVEIDCASGLRLRQPAVWLLPNGRDQSKSIHKPSGVNSPEHVRPTHPVS